MWATDASHLRVVGWGYHCLVTVMADHSRSIRAHELSAGHDRRLLHRGRPGGGLGLTDVTVADRTGLLSDDGSGYVPRASWDHLYLVGITHILATPCHPQTNGELERCHQTIERDVDQVPYEVPSDLEAAFVSHYDYQSSHMAPGNVTPDDVLNGRREQIPQRRGEVQVQTVERHRRYDRTLRQLARCST